MVHSLAMGLLVIACFSLLEKIGKKFGTGKHNDAQPANSDEAESEASDKDK